MTNPDPLAPPATISPLPEGWTEIGRLEIVKCIDNDGKMQIRFDFDDGLTTWEALGLLDAHRHTLLDHMDTNTADEVDE